MTSNIFAIDVFAGAGGLMEGFKRAGFNFIAHIEKDKYCCQTLETRLIYHFLKNSGEENTYYRYLYDEIDRKKLTGYCKDEISNICEGVINIEISDETLPYIIDRIKYRMREQGIKSVDIIIGGPPCQAYSLVGRARDPYGMKSDPRNYLYRYYIQLLEEFNPEIFVFENVPGILTAGKGKFFKNMTGHFEEAGYEIHYELLNSSDFMVLQNRKRVILTGWKKENNFCFPEFQKTDHSYRVNDIFVDLPRLHPGEGDDRAPMKYEGAAIGYLREMNIRTDKDLVVHHKARKHRELDLKIYRLALEYFYQGRRIKYIDLPEEWQTHKNKESFLDRFKVVDLNARASHTVVAHISKDGHYYIHPDREQLRSITVREAARIQSFPDNYIFEGPRTSQFAQVGNAVPPLMAYNIALKIKEMLR